MTQNYTAPELLEQPLNANGSIRLDAPAGRKPGGFWRRLVAAVLDGAIHGVLSFPVTFVLGLAMGLSGTLNVENPPVNTTMLMALNLGSYAISLVVVFFYYGWFYKNKGATPGKMLMGLRVSAADTGTNLTYWKAFFRETVGKLLSSLVLFIGFLLVVFRQDKRALHDLIFKTQVTYESK